MMAHNEHCGQSLIFGDFCGSTGFARQGKMESAQPNIQIVTTGFILDISVLGRALVTSWQSQAALVRQCEVLRASTRPLKAQKTLSEVINFVTSRF